MPFWLKIVQPLVTKLNIILVQIRDALAYYKLGVKFGQSDMVEKFWGGDEIERVDGGRGQVSIAEVLQLAGTHKLNPINSSGLFSPRCPIDGTSLKIRLYRTASSLTERCQLPRLNPVSLHECRVGFGSESGVDFYKNCKDWW